MSNTDASGEKRVTGTSERREQIIQRLRQQGSVQVNDLSALYGVFYCDDPQRSGVSGKAGDCCACLWWRVDLR